MQDFNTHAPPKRAPLESTPVRASGVDAELHSIPQHFVVFISRQRKRRGAPTPSNRQCRPPMWTIPHNLRVTQFSGYRWGCEGNPPPAECLESLSPASTEGGAGGRRSLRLEPVMAAAEGGSLPQVARSTGIQLEFNFRGAGVGVLPFLEAPGGPAGP